jgi:hypothetical protein
MTSRKAIMGGSFFQTMPQSMVWLVGAAAFQIEVLLDLAQILHVYQASTSVIFQCITYELASVAAEAGSIIFLRVL